MSVTVCIQGCPKNYKGAKTEDKYKIPMWEGATVSDLIGELMRISAVEERLRHGGEDGRSVGESNITAYLINREPLAFEEFPIKSNQASNTKISSLRHEEQKGKVGWAMVTLAIDPAFLIGKLKVKASNTMSSDDQLKRLKREIKKMEKIQKELLESEESQSPTATPEKPLRKEEKNQEDTEAQSCL